MYNEALEYLNSGLSVIPVNVGTKQPTLKEWKPYQEKQMAKDQAWQFFNTAEGLAIICGHVSGGLECLDFDNHFGNAKSILSQFAKIVEVEEIIDKYNLPIESSPSGGFHIFFRSQTPGGNQKLARKANAKGRPETLIETRGEGGYVIAAPTSKYVLKRGELTKIPKIEAEERDVLLAAAQSFNEYVAKTDYHSTSKYVGDNDRPGDEYNKSSEAINEAKDLLALAGWKTNNGTHWRRPDKSKGISATFGKIAPEVFYVFSTNAHPFEDCKAYTPWQIYAILKHNFDFEAAAKDLAQRGYGKKNDNLKVVYSKVRKETRKGQRLTGDEINALAEEINIPVNIVSQEVQKAQEKYSEEWEYEKLPAIQKTEIFLKTNYKFRQDVVSRLPYMSKSGGPWEDLNVDTIFREMQHENIKFPFEKLKSLLRSDFVQRWNPFTEYFHSLPEWDGENHIKKLAEHIKVNDQEFFNIMFEKALVRNIACALEPENYNRIVFTLISEKQWIGKSYFIQWINPFGTRYYTDEQLKDNKDSRFALCENFIYNLEELDSLSRIGISQLKATISTRGVKDRLPYAAHKEYFPRCCSFWGSTNRQEFLVDDHNTRWLCFYIKDIDWNYSKLDVHKIWEQAWHLYKSEGYDYNLSKGESETRDNKNDDYRIVDFELSILQKYFTHSENEWMSNAEIMGAIADKAEHKIKFNTTPQKLGRLLSQCGFKRRKVGNERGWKVKLVDAIPKGEEEVPF